MRRITTWALSTISALVLLFSYHTSTGSAGTSIVAAGESAANGTSPGDAGTAGPGHGGSSASGGSSGSTGSTGSTDTPSTSSGSGSSSGSSSSSGSGSSSSSGSGSSGSSSGSGSSTSTGGTYTGDTIQTQFGPVQVQITVRNGKLTKSVVTQVPWSSGRDQEINSYAVPVLNGEAVQAQSAQIDMVSGATFTSDGYIRSLQSAIDRANL